MSATVLKETIAVVSFIAIAISFWQSIRDLEKRKGASYASMAIGVWTEILIVLFPFVIYFIIGWWRSDIDVVLLSPELAMASTVLSGQGVLKFFRGFLLARTSIEHVERALWIIVWALFVFAVSLVVVVLIVVSVPPPPFVPYVQPPLLFVSVLIYFAMGGTGDWALKSVALQPEVRQI